MTRMSEMHAEEERDRETGAANSSSILSSAKRTIVIDVDRKLAERLGVTAQWQGVSEEDLLAEAIEQHSKHSEQRTLTIQVSEAAAARLAAAAATIGMSEEELIAEAIDTYYPREKAARIWPMLGFYGLVLVLPLVLMFISPRIGRSASAVDWTLFASAMLACCAWRWGAGNNRDIRRVGGDQIRDCGTGLCRRVWGGRGPLRVRICLLAARQLETGLI